MKNLIIIAALMLTSVAAFAQAPVLFYSNIITGQCTGGENNQGHWVTITGQNFGASQDASHYVKFVAVSGGTNYTIDSAAYKYWNYVDPQGNYKITFQIISGGSCLADGDYDVKVVTPSGTATLPIVYGGSALSPNTHFHIFSGGSFYFADNNNVSCSDVGAGSYGTPFCSAQKCTESAITAAGNTCYLMPGLTGRVTYSIAGCGYEAYINICRANGDPNKHILIAGYPTSNFSQVADVGCDYTNGGSDCPDTYYGQTIPSKDARYVSVSNLIARSGGGTDTTGGEALGAGGSGYPAHHIRFSDIQVSNITQTWETPTGFSSATYSTYYGITFLKNCGATNKHEGGLYLGESIHDIDVGWSVFDWGFAISDPTCHVGKQVEIHPTLVSGYQYPAPSFGNGNLTAVTDAGGQLANGTYDVVVAYYGQDYYPDWNSAANGESILSSIGKVTLSGANNAIKVTAPTAKNYLNSPLYGTLDDGVTTLCNPLQKLRVYMCLESAGTCTPKYQGDTTYTQLGVQGNMTAPDYTQTATLSTTTAYPSFSGDALGGVYNPSGCFAYNLFIHDNKFYNAPNYAFSLNLGNGSNGPIIWYNNEIVNAGNGASFVGDVGEKLSGTVFEVKAWDGNALQMGQPINISIINNTFYNSGSLNTAVTSYPGIISDLIGATEPTFTATFKNNIMVQPQNGQPFLAATYGNPNTVITGDHNLCFGNATYNGCPAGWNTSGGCNGLSCNPTFTANGTVIHDVAGTSGDIYTGFNLKPQLGSNAIDTGADTSSSGVLMDILGVMRPQNSIYDIGNYEYYVGGGGGGAGGSTINGKTTIGGKVVIH